MKPILTFKNVAITPEGNEMLAELGDEHDRLLTEFNELNRAIYNEKPDKLPTRADAERYAEYGKQADQLQRKMLTWEGKARDFIMRPSLSYMHEGELNDDDRREIQQQIVSSLTLARSDMMQARLTLSANHEHLISSVKNNDSMNLAVRSYRVGKWGLIVGTVGVMLAVISIIIAFSLAA